jgi:hypothetical protein
LRKTETTVHTAIKRAQGQCISHGKARPAFGVSRKGKREAGQQNDELNAMSHDLFPMRVARSRHSTSKASAKEKPLHQQRLRDSVSAGFTGRRSDRGW